MRFDQSQKKIKILYVSLIIVGTAVWLIPIIMMLSVSFMPPDLRSPAFGGIFLPRYSLYNYQLIFNEVPMFRYFMNSVAITVPSVIMVTFFSSLAAYAFARLRFFGRDIWYTLLLLTLMLPIPTLVIPLFQISKNLNMYNTYFGLILPYAALGIPFAAIIFRSFFTSFPIDLENAAKIDGCGAWKIYWNIMIPLSGPSLSVVIIWQTMKSWNEFLLALVTIDKNILKPLPLVPLIYSGQYMSRPGAMFAVLTVMSLPVIAVYIFMQRYFMNGMTSGALKG
jgi:ABC-type glycerol-3-phosphate transport system permease component